MNAFLEQFLGLCRRYPLAVSSVVLTLLLGGTDWFLWRRQVQLANRAERVRREGNDMLLAQSNQPRIQAEHAATRDALAVIDANLASEEDLAGNLDYFYQIEKNTQVRLSNVSQLTTPPGAADARYRAIPFSLRLSGGYAAVLAFLHELETGPRLLHVKNYRFSQNDPGIDALSLDLTVEVLGRP